MADRIQIRRDTAANWTTANPTLAQGEWGFETDTGKLKVGDGSAAWASLAYFTASLTAADVTNTPAGNIAATDIQAAINELDAEKEPADATILKEADIGVTVQAYDADTAKLDVAQSWVAQQTFSELKEGVYTITDGAAFEIDPANGTYQTITLGDNRTPAATNFESGQAVVLMVDDGTAYTLTWTTIGVTWKTDSGSAPTLNTTGYTVILIWKVGTTVYGARIGDA